MVSRTLISVFLLTFATSSECGFFDSIFKPSPYTSEEEAISDLKDILKYVSQCQWVSCRDNGPKGVPSSSPYPSCLSYSNENRVFFQKYNISGQVVKTKHIDWYRNKINEMDNAICD